MSAEEAQQFFALGKDDVAHMDRQRALVAKLAEGLGLRGGLQRNKADLPVLQKIIDSQRLQASQTWELQSLGIVLGDVIAREQGLQWVIVVDKYGRDPALRYKQTSNLAFPLTMISKRIEDRKKVDVEALYQGVSDYVARFGK
jgi:hypothetical protein